MCGIYGMASFGRDPLRAPQVLDRMGEAVRHRGPDDRATVITPGAAIGVERLRITDPRPQAAQPFKDPAEHVWLACNGAIYNARRLRARYADYPYRSRSDIEPILPLYLDRGPEGIAELDGMFAIALWDKQGRRLLLARDRAGEKPLFWTRVGSEVWFASEVQALLVHPAVPRTLDRTALDDYLTLGYALEPRTMFGAIRKVEAGTVAVFSDGAEEVHRFWRPEAIPVLQLPQEEAARRLESHLEDAVSGQLQADVPVGVFSSGGVDSSLLAALATRGGAVHTFTVGFSDPSYDERMPAGRLASTLGTAHHTVVADEPRLRAALDALTGGTAEPIADPAVLPTYLLARSAREHVGVVLSGEGADELFGGYPTYLGHAAAPWFGALPERARRGVARLVGALPASAGRVPLEFLLKRFVAGALNETLERHVRWFGTGLLREADDWEPWPAREAAPVWLEALLAEPDPLRRVMLFDYLTYLRDNLLTKVDRATMLVSLEARAPYLDRALTEFALGLETGYRVRGLTTKWLLKRVARRRLPRRFVTRRKRGLSVPIGRWINDGLRGEVDRLLAPARLQTEGVLRAERVGQLLSEHRSGRVNHARALWPLIILQIWRERWLGD